MALLKFERNSEKTKTFINDVFKTEGSKSVTLALKDGTLNVHLHTLLLPCEFMKTLLSDFDSEIIKVIILPDIEKEDMIKVIEVITTGDTPYSNRKTREIVELMYDVLGFDPGEFTFHEKVGSSIKPGVKKDKMKKKTPYTPFNIFENKRQVFITSDEFTCKFCLKYYYRKDHLKEHLKVCPKAHSKEDLQTKLESSKCFKCEVCNKSLRTKESLRQHMLSHSQTHEILDFSCPTCGKYYLSLTALNCHIKAEGHDHPNPEKHKIFRSQNIPEGFVQCDICGRWVGRMEHHKKTHHSVESRLFECESCDYKTNRRDNFKRHQEDMHKILARDFKCIDETFKGRRPEWHCFDCKITLKTELEIENHIKSKHCHDLKCNICEKQFKKQQHLVQHIRQIHENPQTFKCEECGKSYAHKRSLTKHMKKCKK